MLPGLNKRANTLSDLLIYLAVFQKHIRLMLLLFCFSWLTGIVYYVYARPVYFSRSLVKVDFIDQQISADKDLPENAAFNLIMAQLTAPQVIERTAARLGIVCEYRELLRKYIKQIKTEKNSENQIVVHIYPYNRDWAKRWCETMVRVFLDYREQNRTEEWVQRRENIQHDIEEMQKLLENNKEKSTQLKNQSDTQKATIKLLEIQDLPTELVGVKRKLDDLGRTRLLLINNDLTSIEKLSRIDAISEKLPLGTATNSIPLPSSSNDNVTSSNASADTNKEPINIQIVTPTIANFNSNWRILSDKLDKLENERSQLNVNLLSGHPKIQTIQKQIDAINLQLDAELRNATKKIEMEFTYNLEREKYLVNKLPEYIARLNDVKQAQQSEQLTKNSQDEWQKRIYKRMLQRETDAVAFEREKVNLIYSGLLEYQDSAVAPKPFSLLLFSTILGLILALGIPLLIEFLDDTLSNLDEIESTFKIRGLGIIPKLQSPDASQYILNPTQENQTSLLENFRVIRTNLLSMGALTKSPHVLMVTSALPKEGKTVVSSNLALSFAQSGAKTILVDTDLRRGRLHRLFGYRKQPGLSGVLLGQHSLDDVIRPTAHENFFIISAGQYCDTGTELLGSKTFSDILDSLKGSFDRIVIDTPPVLGLSDTSILLNNVDGVIFVIWSGHTNSNAIKAAIQMLQSNNANFFGFVLNRLDLTKTINYYQYYYYSHDYYYHYQPSHRIESS